MTASSKSRLHPPYSARSAFSLVEVVLALGIVSFAQMGLIGLLVSGLQVGKEAQDDVNAMNLLSRIVEERRSAPSADASSFVLPRLDQAANGEIPLGEDGAPLKDSTPAFYNLEYEIEPETNGLARVYLTLSLPARTGKDKVFAPLITYIRLP